MAIMVPMDTDTAHAPLPIYRSKRVVDITASLLILMLTAPFFALAAIAIKLTHILRGRPLDPLFYAETRMSRGEPFTLYKFNIFKYEQILTARDRGEFIHTKIFERNGGVTWVGWLLKQIYMDELPQFYNVLRGDMSIVGPRPVNKEVYERLWREGSTAKRFVKAGITGNFQSFKHTKGKNAQVLDQEYVDYYRTNPWYRLLWFDTKIMLRTIKVIFRAKGV